MKTLAKILIVIGAFIGIHPFALFFSLPIFLLGVILLFTTKLNYKTKWKWTLIPIIIIPIIWFVLITTTDVFKIVKGG